MGSRSTSVFLGIDTATPHLALALWSLEAGTLAASCEFVGRDHAKRLTVELDGLLQRSGARRDDIAAVAVGVGPGSYTGLRVGIAAAKGLARALGIPLAGADSLAAAAAPLVGEGERVVAAFDARRDYVYAALYSRHSGRIVTLDPPRKIARSELQDYYGDVRLLESKAPDPGFVARQAREAAKIPPEALYL